MNRDRKALILFAPLQGETAKPYQDSGQLPAGLDSLVYIREGEIFWYSTGVLQVLRILPFPWSWLSIGRFIPRLIRDSVYNVIAANRLKIFGSADACQLPTEEELSRFLP